MRGRDRNKLIEKARIEGLTMVETKVIQPMKMPDAVPSVQITFKDGKMITIPTTNTPIRDIISRLDRHSRKLAIADI